jgi:3'-5' exoribonuclease
MFNQQVVSLPSLAPDPLPSMLPLAFRVVSLTRIPVKDGHGIFNEAELFHEQASLRVCWMSHQVNTQIHKGSLVSICWLGKPVSVQGAVRISRLVILERAEPSVNLFRTIPATWVKDRTLVARAAGLWESLSRPCQHLLNAIFWDGNRFHRFLAGPSSLSGHHSDVGGNFRHAVEVAETCLMLAMGNANVCHSVVVTAALLHDAGKADEYRLKPNSRRLTMSPRGQLVGHRHTILEWIAVARATQRVVMPETHYLGLIHALTAAKGAEWLGIRTPVSLEATILSSADRLSGQSALVEQTVPDDSGFGAYHPHLKGRPYVLPTANSVA